MKNKEFKFEFSTFITVSLNIKKDFQKLMKKWDIQQVRVRFDLLKSGES